MWKKFKQCDWNLNVISVKKKLLTLAFITLKDKNRESMFYSASGTFRRLVILSEKKMSLHNHTLNVLEIKKEENIIFND